MTMDPNRLWAKSKREQDREYASMFLPGHLADVYDSAQRVLDATADDQMAALGLNSAEYRKRLRRIVLVAAAVHDLGKANDHFQGMIGGSRNVQQNPQGLRHEWVTILMLGRLRQWLLPALDGGESDFAITEWAVAGHHPAVAHASPPSLCPPGAGCEIELLLERPDYLAALRMMQSAFGLTDPPSLTNQRRNLVGSDNVFEELGRWCRGAQQIWEKMRKSPDRLLVAAAKDCLIAADVAGSALPKAKPNDLQRWDWITNSFADKPVTGDLQAVVDFRLGGSTPREFQTAVAESTAPVTFVKAGCGTGKTAAAYMWAAQNHPTRRLYFCYPTTGTATEGFRDYLFDEAEKTPRIGADLFHGRSDIDFEIVLNTGPDSRSLSEEEARLDALRAWKTPVVACTVDTVLGIVQNNRRGLFAWPALAQSAFVFDEIHAFDDRLFGALLRFLRDLPGLPALLMTASLPKAREQALRAVLSRLGRELNPIAGPPELEELPRYHRGVLADNDPLPQVEGTIRRGGKVLWVCNTVGRVMSAAEQAQTLAPIIYHSRFKYVDRVEQHSKVIEAFKGNSASLAICSQVAEMSLDLSADLLVMDLAPVPAGIQRLGRLNRRAKPGDPTKPFVIVEPDNLLPYTPAELDAARTWLSKLPAENISQKHLAELWEQTSDQPPEFIASAWLDGGPTTRVNELREASPGITVLMDEDLSKVRGKPSYFGRYALPMQPPPRRLDWKAWCRERGLPVAPPGTIVYDRLRGAEWAR
ncbi:MAG TPA: CRISPR-associated helicase Cas3' [Gemmataceae bacterium]|nr:CRISPR-associated helicase Cas3' [Gemmataceae bacterium]